MSGRIFSKPGERPRAIYVIDIRRNVLKDIGKYFKVTESGVSQTSHRAAVALEKDKKPSVIVERLKQKLNLSRV